MKSMCIDTERLWLLDVQWRLWTWYDKDKAKGFPSEEAFGACRCRSWSVGFWNYSLQTWSSGVLLGELFHQFWDMSNAHCFCIIYVLPLTKIDGYFLADQKFTYQISEIYILWTNGVWCHTTVARLILGILSAGPCWDPGRRRYTDPILACFQLQRWFQCGEWGFIWCVHCTGSK